MSHTHALNTAEVIYRHLNSPGYLVYEYDSNRHLHKSSLRLVGLEPCSYENGTPCSISWS